LITFIRFNAEEIAYGRLKPGRTEFVNRLRRRYQDVNRPTIHRARARLNDTLQPDVVCGQHGWWQACPDLDAPGYDPFTSNGANFNLIIGNEAIDPISGSVPHRAYLCQVHRAS